MDKATKQNLKRIGQRIGQTIKNLQDKPEFSYSEKERLFKLIVRATLILAVEAQIHSTHRGSVERVGGALITASMALEEFDLLGDPSEDLLFQADGLAKTLMGLS